jgi:hypothetical protein
MDFACLLAQESLVRAEAAVNEFERVEYFLKAGRHLVILNCGTDVGEDRQFSRSRDEWKKYERRLGLPTGAEIACFTATTSGRSGGIRLPQRAGSIGIRTVFTTGFLNAV